MKVNPGASDAHLAGRQTYGLPIDLRPGQSIALADGPISLAGLRIVPVEFGTGRIRLLVRHASGSVVRRRHGAIHQLSIVETE